MSAPQHDFVHLHNHSEYSLLDGTTRFTDEKGKPSEFMKAMAKDYRALAFTDHGNLYGAVEFYLAAKDVGIKPIIGMEAYIAKGKHTDRGGSRRENCHLTLLSRDFDGYQNLMALTSTAFLEGFFYDPRIDKELLAKHSKGLMALSGCLKGELCQTLEEGRFEDAVKLAAEHRDILGEGNYYIELMDHGLPKQKAVLQGLVDVSKKTGIPTVVTNDCHYHKKDDWDAHDARVCIASGKLLDEPQRLRFETHEFYFKTPAEMAQVFDWTPESLKRTVEIADKCSVAIPVDQILLPHFEVPAGETIDTYLENLCLAGLERKHIRKADYLKRLEFELGVIRKMGFSAYFLIVWDFIHYARRSGIPVGPGRGSGAGSLVAYSLDITQIDPLKHNLLFERFLNPDRKTMPDLDIDFSDEGREQVIHYVKTKYGQSNVAQIITFGSMNARSVVRDVGRVLAMPVVDVDKLAKLIPMGSTLHQALEAAPDLAAAQKDPTVKKLFHLAKKLEGLRRHTGVHAAGTIITKEPVVKYAPLAKGSSGVVTTQYDDVGVQKLGLLKVDFLGLRTLTIIQNAVRFIRESDPDFDLDKTAFDDPKAFELLQRADTFGVFQLESRGMRDLLRKLKPTAFEDISAVLALYRPGPMQAGMLDDFVERKHGHKKVVFDHPLLEDVLKDTYGCLVFQEQVMEISKRLAGFTPGEADGLRKAMGKKIPEEMEKNREKFLAGAAKNKVSPKVANKIFDNMVTFGGYGFNKSHTVAYALISWHTAYLKAHFPVEFMTALLTSEIGRSAVAADDKENKLATYLEAARADGIEVRAPDVSRSEGTFSIERDGEKPAIRFGLMAVKNVGTGAADTIVAARRAGGPFSSLDDLCRRIDLQQTNRKVLESLVKAGALDGLWPRAKPEEARARAIDELEETLSRHSRMKADLLAGQALLFGEEPAPAAGRNGSASARKLSEHELLQNEKEVLGLYFSGHPLLRHRDSLEAVSTHPIEALPREETPVRLAGMIHDVRKLVTKAKGETWARATLEDLTGEVAVLCFPKAYAAGLGKLLVPESVVAVSGRLSLRGDAEAPELVADEITPIEKAMERWGRRLVLQLESAGLETDRLELLQKVLSQHKGSCPVTMSVHTPAHGTALIDTKEKVRLTPELFKALEEAMGERFWNIETAPLVLPPRPTAGFRR